MTDWDSDNRGLLDSELDILAVKDGLGDLDPDGEAENDRRARGVCE